MFLLTKWFLVLLIILLDDIRYDISYDIIYTNLPHVKQSNQTSVLHLVAVVENAHSLLSNYLWPPTKCKSYYGGTNIYRNVLKFVTLRAIVCIHVLAVRHNCLYMCLIKVGIPVLLAKK